ncbi:CoA pyrophosphatase [Pistricoccus aurantiacus]|uniref:CoA pyrophosphatase n=1 Tax=Pistricoccus aurantiacus TaxID=1883414 RepID=A0A5B8SV32_9GAMM|nr:CoA pyrophosphatase [Pistricoccus aurantiacus]QEA39385.1 CoA pyrophosphatase [Pistricoccus aurantiacus]
MLEQLHDRLKRHVPRRIELDLPQAAVLLLIVTRPNPTLLFTLRAGHMKQHAGQVAFPGGKREPSDESLLATALREAKEEVALPPERVKLLGRLSDVLSLYGLRVTPFVGVIPPDLPLVPELGELETIFEAPLEIFLEDRRSHTDIITVEEKRLYVPSYRVDRHVVWGLSAMMLVELLAKGFDRSISLDTPPARGPFRHYPAQRRLRP